MGRARRARVATSSGRTTPAAARRWTGLVESLHVARPRRVVRWLRGNVKKILVVEDDPVNQQILSDFLAANGYETVSASSGPEGIRRFEHEAPELLLVD